MTTPASPRDAAAEPPAAASTPTGNEDKTGHQNAADSSTAGTLVIVYVADGIRCESGGWSTADAEMLCRDLVEEGVAITGVYDGLSWAGEAFPPGTRVHAPRKYWGSQIGTATGTCTVGRTGPNITVAFDDGLTTDWWASGLWLASGASPAPPRLTHPKETP